MPCGHSPGGSSRSGMRVMAVIWACDHRTLGQGHGGHWAVRVMVVIWRSWWLSLVVRSWWPSRGGSWRSSGCEDHGIGQEGHGVSFAGVPGRWSSARRVGGHSQGHGGQVVRVSVVLVWFMVMAISGSEGHGGHHLVRRIMVPVVEDAVVIQLGRVRVIRQRPCIGL
jgi:hypothetical protein